LKQPTYEEVIFENPEYEHVRDVVSKHNIGRTPLYAITDHFNQDETELLINNIKMILIDEKIHPCFPYPFYIVTDKDIDEEFIPLIPKKADLPGFFKHRLKRLHKKEDRTLQKSNILVEKVNNLNIPHKHHEFLSKVRDCKKLHRKTRELYFYQKIYNKLQLNE